MRTESVDLFERVTAVKTIALTLSIENCLHVAPSGDFKMTPFSLADNLPDVRGGVSISHNSSVHQYRMSVNWA